MSHSGAPNRCAVHGMPGIGKTQLLLRYAKLSLDQHQYSYIFWISATSVDKINEGISRILQLIEHPDRYLQDQKAKLVAARLWLEKHGDWLLVFDNVHRDTLSFLRVHLPLENERGNILFSTRTADVAESLVNAAGEQHRILGIQALELRETTDLLFEDAGINAETVTPLLLSQAEVLVKRVGRLPLAVVQVASFMKRTHETHKTFDNMLELYEKKRKMEAIQWENDLTLYEERSVAGAFANQLDELNQQSRDIGNLLKLLSFFDTENIPLDMIVAGAETWPQPLPEPVQPRPKRTILQTVKGWRARKKGHTKSEADDITPPSHTSPEFESLIALIASPIKFQTAMQKLQSLSLVESHSPNGKPSLWIHDLIQFMVRERARTEETYKEWLQSSWSLVYGLFRPIEDPTLPQCWADCEKLLPHLRSLKDAWRDVPGTNPEVTRASFQIAKYLASRGRYNEAEELCKQLLEESEKNLGNDHPVTLASVGNMAYLSWSQGRFNEAEALYKRALEGREKRLGSDHPDVLASMSNLALVYLSQGRYSEAEELSDRALKGKQKYLGVDHPETLTSMSNLAKVYSSQGHPGKAEALYRRVLAGCEKYLGTDHVDTLTSMSNLAFVIWSQRRYEEAEVWHKQALEGRMKLLGPDHPDTFTSLNNLALACSTQGRYHEAEELYKRALEGFENFLGADHPSTLTLVNNLAQIYSSQKRYDEAEALHQRAIHSGEIHLGDDHPDTLTSVNNLGLLYALQERFDEAEVLHERVLKGREKHLGTNHLLTLSSMDNLADVYMSQGRLDLAEALSRRALECLEQLGVSQPTRSSQ